MHGGVQYILCCVFCFFLSSSSVLCMVVSNTYCVVFVCFFPVFVQCLVHGGVHHILCCVCLFFSVYVQCLVHGGVQYILCCVFCLVFCVPNVASFSEMSILDCPFGLSNVY